MYMCGYFTWQSFFLFFKKICVEWNIAKFWKFFDCEFNGFSPPKKKINISKISEIFTSGFYTLFK